MVTPTSPSQPQTSPGLSPVVQIVVSLLLFFHLGFLAIAIVCNARPESELRAALANAPVLAQYTQLLNMDTSYSFNLTDGSPLDTDHFVEIRLDPRNSDSAEPQVLRFPSGVSKVGARAERYRNLLVNAARSLGDEYGNADVENLLPAAIAHKLLSENEIQTGKHRFLLRRTIPLSMDQANSVEERTRDPRNPELIQTPYEADITFYRGEVQVTRAADPLEVSPILREPQP